MNGGKIPFLESLTFLNFKIDAKLRFALHLRFADPYFISKSQLEKIYELSYHELQEILLECESTVFDEILLHHSPVYS